MIGFTRINEWANISHEVRIVFQYFFITFDWPAARSLHNCFGVVAAAIYGNVDCEDYIPHFRLGLSGICSRQ